MVDKNTQQKGKSLYIGLGIGGAALATASIVFLLMNIAEKKVEAKTIYHQVTKITDEIDDPKVWGQNFPVQYESYLKTVDQTRTRYGGSEAMPHTPTATDPRTSVAQSKIEEDPRLVKIWNGYAFAKDFREERGHAYMLVDQLYTERQNVVKQPGTCLQCHASVYTTMKKLGQGDIEKGFHELNKIPYSEAKNQVKHPVTCIDCHEPETMKLRISRPAFKEGIKVYKKSLGIDNYNVDTMATHQEMRSYVCAQCHVEYYFKGEGKTLTFPWSKGLGADKIIEYYDEVGHKDWVHKESGSPLLKAQHPEFELYSQGTHAKAGVACADCHMPYERVGAAKVSDHHVRSPLLNIGKACQTCHRQEESKILGRVVEIQTENLKLRDLAMNAVVELIDEITAAKNANIDAKKLETAQQYHRKAQFLLDFVEAENSSGFHAPQVAASYFAQSIENSRLGQKALK